MPHSPSLTPAALPQPSAEPEDTLAVSRARAESGDLQAAIQVAKEAVWLDPENAVANFNLGLLMADAGSLEASIHQLRKAISLSPFTTRFYLDLSKVQETENDTKGAIETIHRAMQAAPSNSALAAALKRQGLKQAAPPRFAANRAGIASSLLSALLPIRQTGTSLSQPT